MTALAADVLRWLDTDAADVNADDVDRVIAAAYGRLGDDYDLTAASVDQPDRVDQAVVMYAGRLWRRQFSLNGIEAVGDFGALRVSVTDPDIHEMLARWETIRFG